MLPDYDEDRVRPSDIQKVFQWYNLLIKTGEYDKAVAAAAEAEGDESKGEKPASDKKKPAHKPKAKSAQAPKGQSSAPKASVQRKAAGRGS